MTKELYSPYEGPILTVDAVIFQLVGGRLQVLLVERKREPFAGVRALPGVYCPRGETTLEAFERAANTKAGVNHKQLRFVHQLYATDTVARDPRGHAVSIAYLGLGRDLEPLEGTKTEHPEFFPVDELPKLAFDHAEIIINAKDYLKTEAMRTNILATLLPETFTLTQLQDTYELLLGRQLDKRNFRKKLATLDLVTETEDFHKDGAHRPARLYKFTHSKLTEFAQAFV